MKNAPLAIWVWYRGAPFNGFQRQPAGLTVQGLLQRALAEAGIGATANPAGRTDRGVHARMQVVSVRTSAQVSPEAIKEAVDRARPGDLGVACCRRAPAPFHAQWQAIGKEYRYRLALEGPPEARWRPFAWDVASHPRLAGRPPPAPERVLGLLRLACGRRDFWSFHEKSSVRRDRSLDSVELHPLGGGVVEVRLAGDSFGRYQVRYLVGSAVATASGILSEADYRAALDSAYPIEGLKAPAEGLTLWSVAYPPEVDPFTPAERAAAAGVPSAPPFAQA